MERKRGWIQRKWDGKGWGKTQCKWEINLHKVGAGLEQGKECGKRIWIKCYWVENGPERNGKWTKKSEVGPSELRVFRSKVGSGPEPNGKWTQRNREWTKTKCGVNPNKV